MSGGLLAVEDLAVDYLTDAGPVRVVDGVSFRVDEGEAFGLVGEPGAGKSSLAQSLLRLCPAPAAIARGRVLFRGRDVLAMDEAELRAFRWREVSLVSQSAMNALNPLLPVAAQIA